MSIQLTYPGVYVQELPSGSHTITGVTTATTAFVGFLQRGPIDTPVQCFNFGDFQRAFGGLDPLSPTSFQVYQFFLNGGNEAWVSRLVAATPAPVLPILALGGKAPSSSGGGSATPSPPSGATVLNLQAHNPGTWGENMFVSVDYMSNALNTFNLTASLYSVASTSPTSTSYSLVASQQLGAVTLDPTQPNYIAEVLAEKSLPETGLIALGMKSTTPTTPPPFASGTMLTVTVPATPVAMTLAVTVVAPPTNISGKPVTSVPVNAPSPVQISSVADLVGGIQQALSNAAGALKMPGLASAIVRSCTSPFAPTTAGAPRAQLIQIWIPDPTYAGYLIGISGSPSTTFTTLSTNYQAQALAPAVSTTMVPVGEAPPPPNGNPPGGLDVAGNPTSRTGIYALEAMQIVNLIVLPDLPSMEEGDYLTAATSLLDYAQARRAFALVDLPSGITTPSAAVAWAQSTPASFGQGIINAASYFPSVEIPTPFSNAPMVLGPSGTMAGVYAATDNSRGVWKAPAGISASLAGVEALQYVMNDQENGLLNPMGINALRNFPVYSNIAWGARTLAAPNVADDDWKYVPVRRLTLYLEHSLVQGLQWVVFEPNDDTLWAQIRLSVNGFLQPLFMQGAFAGTTPSQAYQCTCDESTTTPTDQVNGIVNIVVQFAPVRPAEFVVITIQQMAGQTSS